MELFISKMAEKINSLLRDIQTQAFSVKAVILFGSAAGNALQPRSDMDICIVTHEDENPEARSKAAMEVEMYIDDFVDGLFPVDYVMCTHAQLKRREKVFKSIMEEGKVIWRPIGK